MEVALHWQYKDRLSAVECTHPHGACQPIRERGWNTAYRHLFVALSCADKRTSTGLLQASAIPDSYLLADGTST
jgi:hypothetical protein